MADKDQSSKFLLLKFNEAILSRTYRVLTLIGLSIALAIYSYVHLNRLNDAWLTHYQTHNQVIQAISNLNHAMGYGGYIHNFKNTVLRKNAKLLAEINEESNSILANLLFLKQLHAEDQELLVLLRKVESTFIHYQNKHTLLKEAIEKEWPPNKTDYLVQIDDREAVASLKQIIQISNQRMDTTLNNIQQKITFYKLLLFIAILLLATMGLLLLTRRNQLQQQSRKLAHRLSSIEAVYESTLKTLADPCFVTDHNGIIEKTNALTEAVFGYTQNELTGQSITLLIPESKTLLSTGAPQQTFKTLRQIISTGQDIHGKKKTGEYLPIKITLTPFTVDGEKKYVCVIEDNSLCFALIQQLGDTIGQLSLEASTDPLTGLKNRRSFHNSFNQLWSIAERQKQTISVLWMNLDHFKDINDQFGYAAGDQLLKTVAELLKDHTRKSDIVCRYSGEEFVMVTFNHSDEQITKLAERIILETASKKIEYEGHKLSITLSMGIASTHDYSNQTLESLMNKADKALGEAKQNGRNRYQVSTV